MVIYPNNSTVNTSVFIFQCTSLRKQDAHPFLLRFSNTSDYSTIWPLMNDGCREVGVGNDFSVYSFSSSKPTFKKKKKNVVTNTIPSYGLYSLLCNILSLKSLNFKNEFCSIQFFLSIITKNSNAYKEFK